MKPIFVTLILLLTIGMIESRVIGLNWNELKEGEPGKVTKVEGYGEPKVQESFASFAAQVNKEGQAPSNPVVIVPGIGGSVMDYYTKQGNQYGGRVWVDLLDATNKAERYFLGEYNEKTGLTETFDPDTYVATTDSNNGLFAIQNLDPSDILPVTDYFQKMITVFESSEWGYVSGESLFGLPYDFRQTNMVHLDRLMALIEKASNAMGGKKVHLLSHSMGGLICKIYVALHPDHANQYLASYSAIAGPFLGAAGGTFESFLQGYQIIPAFIYAKSFIHPFQVACATLYELLPANSPQWKTVNPPYVQYEENGSSNVVFIEQYPQMATQALKDFTFEWNGQNKSLGWEAAIWQNTLKVRSIYQYPINTTLNFPFNNIQGIGTDTHFDMIFEDPVSSPSDLLNPKANYNFTTVDGDGTVPHESALTDGFPNRNLAYTVSGVTHQKLVADQNVIDLTLCFFGRKSCPN